MFKKVLVIGLIGLAAIGAGIYFYATRGANLPEKVRIYVPKDATAESLRDSLETRLGGDFGAKVYNLWNSMDGDIARANGSYEVAPGEKAYELANRIAKGRQTPVKLVVNVARTLGDLTDGIAAKVEASPGELIEAMDSVFAQDPEYCARVRYTAAILPDTYEVYWNATPRKIIETLAMWRDKFWTEERLDKAKKIGLSPAEVVTLASIVEEESNKKDEQPRIAGLYLNRLAKGMKLQADPTVKFALGDFAIRRVTASMLETDSPYNTYRNLGLPPGPIRVPQKSTIDAVLNPEHHSYIYMCAKEDFSGYHNFTADYNTHLANAKRYAAALNKNGIK